jgi:hypothetical protein
MPATTLDLGKVDYNRSGRRINAVDLRIELKESSRGPVFSASGGFWNGQHTDYTSCGQVLEEIASFFKGSKRVQRIVEIWREYHLNDMNAGTIRQEAELAKHTPPSGGSHYDWACETLMAAGIYEDNGYKYGTAWLYRPIPDEILAEIKSWFPEGAFSGAKSAQIDPCKLNPSGSAA